jgi:DNA-binding transcriptional MerR regulator
MADDYQGFKTISDVASLLGVQQHVLRFWETKFSQITPVKRAGNRRYYRPEDVAVIQAIHALLYHQGYTVKGAQKRLKGMGKQQIVALLDIQPVKSDAIPVLVEQKESQKPEKSILSVDHKKAIHAALLDLKALKQLIAKAA